MRNAAEVLILGAAMALAACGKEAAAPSGKPAAEAPVAKGAGKATGKLAEALECWGLTKGSYFLHMASPETAGDLPKASESDYRAWNNQAETIAKAQGISLAQFNILRDPYDTNLVSPKKREASVGRLKTCIATVPTEMLSVETPILVGE